MNPEIDTSPGLGLPQPSAEIGQATFGYAPDAIRAPEVAAPRFETGAIPQPPSQAQAGQFSPLPLPQQPAAIAALNTGVAAQDAQQDDNADTSAVDSEWVSKAKEIVERTHTDPYLQSRELGKVKAQYIKARYNKEIKVSEEP
jgi:hypothetical protein